MTVALLVINTQLSGVGDFFSHNGSAADERIIVCVRFTWCINSKLDCQ